MTPEDEKRLLLDAIEYGLFDDVEPNREKLKKRVAQGQYVTVCEDKERSE
jgi:hypothetical protein